jgi:hypothetical protein
MGRLKETISKFSDFTASILAVFAIGFAIVQFFDSRTQLRKITEVSESTSTSFAGEFPKNIDDITRLVGRATDEVDIMVDFPGYGHYSSPDAFSTYLRAIEDAARKHKVMMLIYNDKAAHESRQRQFRPTDFAAKMKTDAFQRFFTKTNPFLGVPTSYDEFDEKLTKMQTIYEEGLSRTGVQIRHIGERLQFYLWLEDMESAVFSFQNSVREEHEIAFRTRDGKLIDTFKATFDDLWNKSNTIGGRFPPH